MEESGSINGGLQTLNLVSALAVQLRHASALPCSQFQNVFSLSMCCLVVDLLARSACEYIEMFFLQQKFAVLLFPTSEYTPFYAPQNRSMLLFAWCFLLIYSVSLWEVCPEGLTAGVRSLPVHQQKSICTSPGKSYQLGGRASLSLRQTCL